MTNYTLEDSGQRYSDWLHKLRRAELLTDEFLIETVEVPVPNTPLPPVSPVRALPQDARAELAEAARVRGPWGYSIPLAENVTTGRPVGVELMNYRSHLIMGGIRHALGGSLDGVSVLDMACNHGLFSLMARAAGASSVYGVDLRPENIEKSRFLKAHYDIDDGVTFDEKNVYDVEGQYDVVLNLGLLYHVVDPYRLVAMTRALSGRIGVIDTITHRSPVSAFIQRTNKDVARHAEGEYSVEVHPTYRALLDLMLAVGFKRLIEVRPQETADRARHTLYERCERRCIIGFT